MDQEERITLSATCFATLPVKTSGPVPSYFAAFGGNRYLQLLPTMIYLSPAWNAIILERFRGSDRYTAAQISACHCDCIRRCCGLGLSVLVGSNFQNGT